MAVARLDTLAMIDRNQIAITAGTLCASDNAVGGGVDRSADLAGDIDPGMLAAVPRNGSERTPKLLVNCRFATGWAEGIEMAAVSVVSSPFHVWNSARKRVPSSAADAIGVAVATVGADVAATAGAASLAWAAPAAEQIIAAATPNVENTEVVINPRKAAMPVHPNLGEPFQHRPNLEPPPPLDG